MLRGFNSWAGKRGKLGAKFVAPELQDKTRFKYDRKAWLGNNLMKRNSLNKAHEREKRSIFGQRNNDVTRESDDFMTLLQSGDVMKQSREDDVIRRIITSYVTKRSDDVRRGFSPWAGKRSAPINIESHNNNDDDVITSQEELRLCIATLVRLLSRINPDMTSLAEGGDVTDAEPDRSMTSQVDLMDLISEAMAAEPEEKEGEEEFYPNFDEFFLRNRKASFGPWNGRK